MRFITFINNPHIPKLYQDHLNRSGCVPMAENQIYNIQLHLRHADFNNSILSSDIQRLTTNYVLFQ